MACWLWFADGDAKGEGLVVQRCYEPALCGLEVNCSHNVLTLLGFCSRGSSACWDVNVLLPKFS